MNTEDEPTMREQMHAIVAPMVARGPSTMPQPNVDAATAQVALAFPRAKPMRAVSVFTVIRRCGSPRLRHAVDAGAIRPTWAAELCLLDHQGQDAIVVLGGSAVGYAAREISRIRRLHARMPHEEGDKT